MDSPILLIRTGGTIDAEPYDDPRQPPQHVTVRDAARSLILPTIAALPGHPVVESAPCAGWNDDRFVKDSQLFTLEDIAALAEVIRACPQRCILITHGTDAMAKNATALRHALPASDKVVIFVGAMVPLSMPGSDGSRALHFALASIAHQPPGVQLVAWEGNPPQLALFDPARVTKDRPASLAALCFMVDSR